MSKLVPPHGGKLLQRLLRGEELAEAEKKARELPRVHMTSRETSDLIMIGIGAFSPVIGFMGSEDWKGSAKNSKWATAYSGLFRPRFQYPVMRPPVYGKATRLHWSTGKAAR